MPPERNPATYRTPAGTRLRQSRRRPDLTWGVAERNAGEVAGRAWPCCFSRSKPAGRSPAGGMRNRKPLHFLWFWRRRTAREWRSGRARRVRRSARRRPPAPPTECRAPGIAGPPRCPAARASRSHRDPALDPRLNSRQTSPLAITAIVSLSRKRPCHRGNSSARVAQMSQPGYTNTSATLVPRASNCCRSVVPPCEIDAPNNVATIHRAHCRHHASSRYLLLVSDLTCSPAGGELSIRTANLVWHHYDAIMVPWI